MHQTARAANKKSKEHESREYEERSQTLKGKGRTRKIEKKRQNRIAERSFNTKASKRSSQERGGRVLYHIIKYISDRASSGRAVRCGKRRLGQDRPRYARSQAVEPRARRKISEGGLTPNPTIQWRELGSAPSFLARSFGTAPLRTALAASSALACVRDASATDAAPLPPPAIDRVPPPQLPAHRVRRAL